MKQQRIKVYGPPGTGKTTYCLDLLCEHLQAGDRVLFLSFTKAAKLEAEGRLIRTFGAVPDSARVSTIHALCLRMLNIPTDALFDKPEVQRLFYHSVGAPYSGGGKADDRIAEALRYHNYTRNTCYQIRSDEKYTPFIDGASTQAIIDSMQRFKQQDGYVDFTDMLTRVANGEGDVEPYDVVIIDEAQDLTTLQWKVVDRLYANAHMVYVVGDDDQALYAFLGADVGAFLAWPCDAVRTLSVTHRLPKPILDFSLQVAAQIVGRQHKEVTAVGDKPAKILDAVHIMECLQYGHRATELYLVRNNYMMRRVQKVLACQGVPYRGPYSPYTDFTHSWAARAFRGICILHYWRENYLSGRDWKKLRLVMQGREAFIARIEENYSTENDSVTIPPLHALFRDRLTRIGWWEDFIPTMNASLASTFKLALSLHSLADCMSPRMDVSTIHGAKGREADRVYVCSALTDKVRHGIQGNRYDEHRLFYVGVTRSKHELYIINDFDAAANQYRFPQL